MLNLEEKYRTVEKPCSGTFTDKNSKFISFVFPMKTKSKFDKVLEVLKQKYQGATHYVYAYRIGISPTEEVFRDSGEPMGSAGIPILNVLKKHDLTNCGIIVIRFFGGKKLGKPGLKEAYSTTAEMAVNKANIVEMFAEKVVTLVVPYPLVEAIIMAVESEFGRIIKKQFGQNIMFQVAIKKYKYEDFMEKMENLQEVTVIEED